MEQHWALNRGIQVVAVMGLAVAAVWIAGHISRGHKFSVRGVVEWLIWRAYACLEATEAWLIVYRTIRDSNMKNDLFRRGQWWLTRAPE